MAPRAAAQFQPQFLRALQRNEDGDLDGLLSKLKQTDGQWTAAREVEAAKMLQEHTGCKLCAAKNAVKTIRLHQTDASRVLRSVQILIDQVIDDKETEHKKRQERYAAGKKQQQTSGLQGSSASPIPAGPIAGPISHSLSAIPVVGPSLGSPDAVGCGTQKRKREDEAEAVLEEQCEACGLNKEERIRALRWLRDEQGFDSLLQVKQVEMQGQLEDALRLLPGKLKLFRQRLDELQ